MTKFHCVLGLLAIGAIVIGATTIAEAASSECTGAIKWNGSESNPEYAWIMTGPPGNQTMQFCPPVTCNDPMKICLQEVGFPEPPSVTGSRWCDCNDTPEGQTPPCTTIVATNPDGTINSVNCNGGCPEGQQCKLTTISAKDRNGMYDARCECR